MGNENSINLQTIIIYFIRKVFATG